MKCLRKNDFTSSFSTLFSARHLFFACILIGLTSCGSDYEDNRADGVDTTIETQVPVTPPPALGTDTTDTLTYP